MQLPPNPLRTRRPWRHVVLLVLLAVGTLVPAGANAAVPDAPVQDGETLTWSVRPTPSAAAPERPNYAYEVAGGDVVSDSIRVRNFGKQPLPLAIYASDALITETGAIDLLPAGVDPTGVGAWIALASSSIVVPPDAFVDVPFTMTLPDNVESGDHAGGIVTSHIASGAGDDGQPVRLDRRLGSRVHVRVGGELQPELEVTDLTTTYDGPLNPASRDAMRVRYTVVNRGNVRLSAHQAVNIEGLRGLTARRAVIDDLPELLPGSSLTVEVAVDGVWPAVRTTTSIELTPVPTREGDEFPADVLAETASTTTWTIPWGPLVLLLLVVGGPLGWKASRRRRSRREEARIQAAVSEALAAAGSAALVVPAPDPVAVTIPPTPPSPERTEQA